MDMNELEKCLIESKHCTTKLIVTDGVFSMDGCCCCCCCCYYYYYCIYIIYKGDIAPLDKICDLADKYDALVMTDEVFV